MTAAATRLAPSVTLLEPSAGRAEPSVTYAAEDASAARRRPWKRLAVVVLAGVLVAELVLVGPWIERAWFALRRPSPGWLALAVLTELLSMGAFARVQRRLLSAGGPVVPMRRMAALTYAANALSVTFPGGTALSSGYVFKRLRSWGATGSAAGFTIVASGVLSTLSFALLALVCALVAGSGGLGSVLVVLGIVAVAAVAVLVRRRYRPDALVRLAGRGLMRVNRILHRPPQRGLAGLQRLAGELLAIKPRGRDWLAALGFAGLNWIADLACLATSAHAVGASGSSLVLVMVAYFAGMSASSLSLLPGGLGPVDAAMVFALSRGGVSTVPATAAVLLYRLISLALVVALGWLVWSATWLADRRRAGRIAPLTARTRRVTRTGVM